MNIYCKFCAVRFVNSKLFTHNNSAERVGERAPAPPLMSKVTEVVSGRSLTAGKIIFTERQTCSLSSSIMTLWLELTHWNKFQWIKPFKWIKLFNILLDRTFHRHLRRERTVRESRQHSKRSLPHSKRCWRTWVHFLVPSKLCYFIVTTFGQICH